MPPASGRAPWRFASELQTPGGLVLRWVLCRRNTLSPRQLIAAMTAVGAVSLSIALFFWLRGATLVLPFAGIELFGLAAALLVHARHAGDHETLTLREGVLEVAHQHGTRTNRTEFRACWVRVEPEHGDASLVELTGQGRRAHVGRYLAPHQRPALAQELRQALRNGVA